MKILAKIMLAAIGIALSLALSAPSASASAGNPHQLVPTRVKVTHVALRCDGTVFIEAHAVLQFAQWSPVFEGQKIIVERKSGKRWVKIGTMRVLDDYYGNALKSFHGKRGQVLRVRIVTGNGLSGSVSRPITVPRKCIPTNGPQDY